MTKNSTVSVKLLDIDQKSFTIRLRVLRVGSETYCGPNFSSRIRKMIMIDDEGIQIGVIIFNDAVNHFAGKFEVNKTYLISNGEVKKVNPLYPSAHPEKELVLKKYSIVKNATEDIEDNMCYNFVKFKDIDPELHKHETIDIYGIVIKVKDCRVTTNSRVASKNLREITVMNQEYHPIVVCLWEDMAKNEGCVLHQIADQKPIVAVTKLIAKKYLGELQLQTTAASILQVHPTCEEIDHIKRWSHIIQDPLKVLELSMIQRMKDKKEVTLEEIIHKRHGLCEDTYYCFTGIVENVLNKSSLSYDSCKNCAASVFKNDDNTSCKKCHEEEVETTPRFRLVLNVMQGNNSAIITMFEDAATLYVGCPINEYLSSISEGEHESKYYKRLSLQTPAEFRFMIALNKKTELINGKLSVIADAFERIQPVLKEEIERVTSNESIKSNDLSKEHVVPLKHDGNKKKRVKKMKKDDIHNIISSKDGNKVKRLKIEMKEDDIDILISSDDEETLNNLKNKYTKKSLKSTNKKIYPTIKIKQEKN